MVVECLPLVERMTMWFFVDRFAVEAFRRAQTIVRSCDLGFLAADAFVAVSLLDSIVLNIAQDDLDLVVVAVRECVVAGIVVQPCECVLASERFLCDDRPGLGLGSLHLLLLELPRLRFLIWLDVGSCAMSR